MEDIQFSKKILAACALTYLSSSLASLLNFIVGLRFGRGDLSKEIYEKYRSKS